MAGALDLNLMSAARTAGRDYPELLCLHAAAAPRRAARGRDLDRLVLYLSMSGNAPLPPGKQDQALTGLAQVYYNTPGSVTAALRRVAEEFNATLLERNLRLSSSSRQGLAVLVQAVVRGERLYLAHSGPAYSFLIAAGGSHLFYDPEMDEHGLGQGKVTPISFFQAELQSSDTLLLSTQPSPEWTREALNGLHGQGPESLRRKLFAASAPDLNAVLLQVRPGKGVINLPRPGIPPAEAAPAAATSLQPAAALEAAVALEPAAPPVAPPVAPPPIPAAVQPPPPPAALEPAPPEIPPATPSALPAPAAPEAMYLPAPDDLPPWEVGDEAPAGVDALETGALYPDTPGDAAPVEPPLQNMAGDQAEAKIRPAAAAEMPEQPAQPALMGAPAAVVTAAAPAVAASTPAASAPAAAAGATAGGSPAGGSPAGARLASVGAALSGAGSAAGRGLRAFLARLLPEDVFAGLPSSLMAFVALAVPVVVVIIASMVYLRLGRDVQYETLMAQAQSLAARGLEQADVSARRSDLSAVLGLLDKARRYRVESSDALDLRRRVQTELDELELIQRVSYQPAVIGGLPAAVRVSRMAAIGEDLYLLDSVSGQVIRAVFTEQGFQVDPAFQCGPTTAGSISVGSLIDIIAWPAGFEPEAVLMGMDASGGVVYCKPDAPPVKTEHLARPETENWGRISGFSLDLGDTYVLDAPSHGVWIYPLSNYEASPTKFFNGEIPALDDVVDLVANRDDLYMLHLDGHLTLCGYSTFAGVPTRCSQPRYTDFRPGRDGLPLVPPAPFVQLQNTAPPDPSLFLLEGQTQAIYHFSLRNLAFQQQYLPQEPLAGGAATAFLVDNLERYLYLALGSQIYYAVMP
ncbi:MAG: hypothetical protein ACKOC5_17845 [Chloroflexota bacterium]